MPLPMLPLRPVVVVVRILEGELQRWGGRSGGMVQGHHK